MDAVVRALRLREPGSSFATSGEGEGTVSKTDTEALGLSPFAGEGRGVVFVLASGQSESILGLSRSKVPAGGHGNVVPRGGGARLA